MKIKQVRHFLFKLNSKNNYQWNWHWWCVSINLTTIISNIQRSLRKGSGWVTDSAIDHAISISKYNPLAGSSYIKLPKELDHPRKGLINIQNVDDNESFKWSIFKYSNPANRHPAKITKADKDFAKKLDFKDIKFHVKIRDINKIEKKNSISISAFGYENKEKHQTYVSKKYFEEKYADLLLTWKEGMRHNDLIKDFNIFMYRRTTHHGKNIFFVIVYKRLVQKTY